MAKWLRFYVELPVETAMIFILEKLMKLDKKLNEIESQPGLFVSLHTSLC